jgi:TM2 domain-containing membrane protein YozV
MTPLTNLIVVIFLGWTGLHKFLTGKKGLGLAYLLTGGLFGIGWLVDIIIAAMDYARGTAENKKGVVINVDGLREEELEVAGVSYCKDSVMSLAYPNTKWGTLPGEGSRRIYHYYFTNKPVALVPETANVHDPDAVMVMIADRKVGYIPAGDAPRIRKLILEKKICTVSASIHGGEYKGIAPDGSVFTNDTGLGINLKIAYK